MATTSIDRTESELRAAARRRGLTMKELAAKMGVSASYLSQIANGRRPWTPKMREKAASVLGEVPGQGTVYRQGGVVTGESSFIRECACTLGMTIAGTGRPRWRVLRLHDGRISWPQAHGRQGPGAGRVGVAGPGEGCARTVRQPPGMRGERGEQLHQGAGQGVGHEPAGPGRPRGGVLQLHGAGGRAAVIATWA